jgi:hypothetical protein
MGRSGVLPENWHVTCAELKTAIAPSVLGRRIISSVMESNKMMFGMWQRHNGLAIGGRN